MASSMHEISSFRKSKTRLFRRTICHKTDFHYGEPDKCSPYHPHNAETATPGYGSGCSVPDASVRQLIYLFLILVDDIFFRSSLVSNFLPDLFCNDSCIVYISFENTSEDTCCIDLCEEAVRALVYVT